MFPILSALCLAVATGMARLTPQEAREKWQTRTQAAVPDFVAGIRRVTQAPGQAAAAKKDKYVAGIQANTDKWARNVGAVPLNVWQDRAENVGAARIATGVTEKGDKYEDFASRFYPHLDAGVAKVKSMPDTTIEQRMQRAVAMMQHNARFRK